MEYLYLLNFLNARFDRIIQYFIRDLHNFTPRSKTIIDAGAIMGIHYDYKSTRNEKAMKKEAKRKARIEERRAKKTINPDGQVKKEMHDIEKPITLEDLTNPDKS